MSTPANQPHIMFPTQSRMTGQYPDTVADAAALGGLQTSFIAERTVLLLLNIFHRQDMLRNNHVVVRLTIDHFYSEIPRLELTRRHPGLQIDLHTQTWL